MALHQRLMSAIVEHPPVLLGWKCDSGRFRLNWMNSVKLRSCGTVLDRPLKFKNVKILAFDLKIGYNRVNWYYIELTRAQAEQAPDHHSSSNLENAERYITPELKTFEDKVLSSESRALAREKCCSKCF